VVDRAIRAEAKFVKTNLKFKFRNPAGDRSFKLIATVKPDTRFLYELFETGTRGGKPAAILNFGVGEWF